MSDMAFSAADVGQKVRLFCIECKQELAYGNIDATPIVGHPNYGKGCTQDGLRWTAPNFSLTVYPPV